MPQAEPVLDAIVLLVGLLAYCIGPPAQRECAGAWQSVRMHFSLGTAIHP